MTRHIAVFPLVALVFSALASAQNVIEALSFGQRTPISPDGRAIPGWHLSGENPIPQLLSDRLILTPPAPGSTRGALWAETSLVQPDWSAEVEFRASGQERGTGNLQIWFVKDGRGAVGQSSVYTIGKFDGFALVIDQYAGRSGSIRGFLNDGSASFRDHHNVDSLAFGHCDYAYRNLGRPSKLRIENGPNGLKIEVDDKPCFSSSKVKLPPAYYFGISAATAETPDSFELNKFVVSTTTTTTTPQTPRTPQGPQNPQSRNEPDKRQHLEKLDKFPSSPQSLPDTDASTIQNQNEQFADLHNRLQGMTHQIANIFGEFDKLSRTLNDRHGEVLKSIPAAPNDAIAALSRRLESIERTVQIIQKDVEGRDYKEHLSNLQQAVEGVRGGLTDHLPDTISQSKPSTLNA